MDTNTIHLLTEEMIVTLEDAHRIRLQLWQVSVPGVNVVRGEWGEIASVPN